SYQNGQTYTILTAQGGVGGTFDATTLRSAFLKADTIYNQDDIQLSLSVIDNGNGNGAGGAPSVFDGVANTGNQTAVAHSLDTPEQSGDSLKLYNAVLALGADEAREAYEQLGGINHATANSSMVQNGRSVDMAINSRLRTVFNGVGANSGSSSGSNANSGSGS